MSKMERSSPKAGQVHSKKISLATTLAGLAAAGHLQKIPGVESTPAPETPAPEEKKRASEKRREHERPTTMPRNGQGQHINPSRRQKREIKASFREAMGRRMNGKAWKKFVRRKKGLVPGMLDLEAMIPARQQ